MTTFIFRLPPLPHCLKSRQLSGKRSPKTNGSASVRLKSAKPSAVE
jgi:hypothetical protein